MSESVERIRPSLTVDIVVVARAEGRAQVLLVRRKRPPFAGQWALPGGFVEPFEPLEQAARRELWEETGVDPAGVPLEQLHAFGDAGRDPRGWTISVAYMACLNLTDSQDLLPRAGSDAQEVGWFDLAALPPLAFDHAKILAFAGCRLGRDRLANSEARPVT